MSPFVPVETHPAHQPPTSHAPNGVGGSMTSMTSRAMILAGSGRPTAMTVSLSAGPILTARPTPGPLGTSTVISSLAELHSFPMAVSIQQLLAN